MKKAWIINYGTLDRQGQHVWYGYKTNYISRQSAELDLKRCIENDRKNNDWALFEMVAGFNVVKELVPAVIEEMNVQPLEAVPGPNMGANDGDAEGFIDDGMDDFDDPGDGDF